MSSRPSTVWHGQCQSEKARSAAQILVGAGDAAQRCARLEGRVFTTRDPKKIALSLKRSAERSRRRKAGPFQSAMSMLNFYLNRAGRNLSAARRKPLEQAKDELRRLYGRDTGDTRRPVEKKTSRRRAVRRR